MNARQPVEQEPPVSLANRLRERIRREGAISFCDWMRAALYDPAEGYYCRRDLARWGSAGDYRTSPERSSLFAATFARYFAQLDVKLGAPRSLTIVEAGAGAGHFAAGVLETLRRDEPQIFARTRYLIDEASADTRERANLLLAPFKERVEFRRLSEIDAPLDAAIVFANELLDAFPVHRVTMRDGRLLELCVECDTAGEFTWVERAPTTPRLADYFRALQLELEEGQLAEVNLAALDWVSTVAMRFRRGFLVTVDYGAEANELYGSPARSAGTLRAFHQHRFAEDPLAQPGRQDLTTTVDWTSIRRAGAEAGLQTIILERQDKFLLQAGLLEQLEQLSASARSEAELAALRAGARHMILPDGMSTSFQVLVQATAESPA
jgi:SAM-dependent MidA family methyltransferase